MDYLWKLRPYYLQVAGALVLGSIAGIVMNTAVVLPAIFLGRAIDTALDLEQGRATSDQMTLAVLLLVGGTLLTEAPRVLKRWWLITANHRIRANLRADALRGALAKPIADLHRTSIGDQLARIVGDVEVLGVGVREFTVEAWDTVLFSCSFVVAMLFIDFELTLIALAPVPIAMLIAHASGRWVAARTARAREANAALTASIQELLAGFRVLRLFGRGSAATAIVERASNGFAARNLAAARLRLGLPALYSTLMMSGVLCVIWLGGQRVTSGAMTVGVFVGYLALFVRFAERAFRIPQLVNSIQSGGAAYARLAPMLAPALSAADEPRYSSFRSAHLAGLREAHAPRARREGAVGAALERVTFSYPGAARAALADLTLDVEPGSFVAITGPVGSGKSALARALLGIYPVTDGTVRLYAGDGAPVEPRPGVVGYLPQHPQLFSGSVRDNVSMGDAAVPTRGVEEALRIAAVDSDVAAFPQGLGSELGELGIRVSGGQQQRLALARAIAAYAPDLPGLLVLDDPFSAVDIETEVRIVSALRDAFGAAQPAHCRVTIVLCSQRLAAFPHADRVVVLDRGRIEEQGTHAALMARGGLYARIYRAQARTQSAVETAA